MTTYRKAVQFFTLSSLSSSVFQKADLSLCQKQLWIPTLTLILLLPTKLHDFLLMSLRTGSPGSSPPTMTREACSSSLQGSQLSDKPFTGSTPPRVINICQQNTTGEIWDHVTQISGTEHTVKYNQHSEPGRTWSAPWQELREVAETCAADRGELTLLWGNVTEHHLTCLASICWGWDYEDKEAHVNVRSCF